MRHILLLLLLWTSALVSAQTPWDGSKTEPALAGTTYSVATAEELAWIATESQTTDFTGYRIVLTADIDLGGKLTPAKKWPPIGCAAHPFNGELDGQNHVIRNLYIFGAEGAAGLLAETGEQAEIHHLALSQGQIITDGVNDIGCFIGIHRGNLHHCFNMAHILANNGNRVGGLVGSNHGHIAYAYNTGLVTKANTQVGGLAGYNQSTATLEWCYNTGYNQGASQVGSLFGVNEAPKENLQNIYFDQQVTRMHATGAGSADPLLTNADYAVVKTEEMDSLFAGNDQWDLSLKGAAYPQLACFAGMETSILSVHGIWLDTKELPLERAEGVGAPKDGNKPRKDFGLGVIAGINATWVSENPGVITIKGSRAEVHRPCGNQEIILSVSLGSDTKQIYTIVKGYDAFDPGSMGGNGAACWNEKGVTMNRISTGGKDPSGGKDDEQSGATAYQYELIRFSVTYDEDSNYVYTPLDTAWLDYPAYSKYMVPTDVPGLYAFRRYVHDAQCHTEFTESPGTAYLTVRMAFDAGKLVEKPDTIYGVPVDTVVLSAVDASGGDGKFEYGWTVSLYKVDYVQDIVTDTIYLDETVRKDKKAVKTKDCPVTLTEAGEYVYKRYVTEESCTGTPAESDISHRIVVFDSLYAGAIESTYQELCVPQYEATILESDTGAVSGGNGRYIYRWLCNGVPVAESDTVVLPLDSFPMEAGHTYEFVRQVKDDTGFTDWQTSAGKVTLVIYTPYSAGSITAKEDRICLEPNQAPEVTLHVANQQAASGDGDFVYAWLLYQAAADTVLLDTLELDAPSLDYAFSLDDYELTAPVRLLLQRTVQNSRCKTEWQHSDGWVDYTIGMHRYDTLDVPVCALELPYTGTYTYADSHTSTYTIQKDSDRIAISDLTPEGCPYDVLLIGRAIYEPEVDVQPVLSVCQTDTVFYLQYSVRVGTPDHYDLSFDDAAKAVGFTDIAGGELTDSTQITIAIPTTKLGSYVATIRFYTATVGESECKGVPIEVPFSLDMDGYVHRKWNDVVFVDNSDKNCEPNCEEDLTFVAWQWYKNDQPIEGATGQSYYESGGLNGYYQVVMTASDGTVYRSCRYEMRPAEAIDNVLDDRLRLYPVPAAAGSLLYVEAESCGLIEWYNMEGVCCYRQPLTDSKGSVRVPAAGGLYLLRWTGDNRQVITRKLIVL